MKKSTLLIAGLPLLGIAYYLYNKAKETHDILLNISKKIANINIVSIDGSMIKIKTDVVLTNNTEYSFSIENQDLITLKKIEVFSSEGKQLLESNTNITGIQLNPYGQTVIQDLIIEGNFVDAALEYFKNGFTADYDIQLTINVGSKSWVI